MSAQPTVAMSTLTDFIWGQYEFMIKTSNITVVNLPGHIARMIGDSAVDSIADSYSAVIGAPVKRFMDNALDMVRIMPANFQLGHKCLVKGGAKPKHPVVKKDKTPRPPNAFILYRQRHHPLLKAKYPNLHNNQISIILGKQWQLENEETKAQFKSKADSLKKEHLDAHPDYQYQPRKSSEKKRRMTRRRDDHISSTGVATNSNRDVLALEVVNSETELAQIEATVFDDSMPEFDGTNFDFSAPDFETTAAGNPIFELGDEVYDDDTFAAMLEDFNSMVGDNPNDLPNSILYSEPTEGSQDDYNLFDTFLHFDKLLNDV